MSCVLAERAPEKENKRTSLDHNVEYTYIYQRKRTLLHVYVDRSVEYTCTSCIQYYCMCTFTLYKPLCKSQIHVYINTTYPSLKKNWYDAMRM